MSMEIIMEGGGRDSLIRNPQGLLGGISFLLRQEGFVTELSVFPEIRSDENS